MIPDLEQRMNDELDKASVKEVIPDFDHEQEWAHLAQRLPAKKRVTMPVWRIAAAVLLLVAVGGLMRYLLVDGAGEVAIVNNAPVGRETAVAAANDTDEPGKLTVVDTLPPAADMKRRGVGRKGSISRKYASNDVIYNGTPCPIELRISQVIKCPNNMPRAINSSSTLEPDQVAQLNYKEKNAVEKNCSLTVDEIEIKSIATGEVILLNSKSSPITAQEVFGYITREREGNVLAGVFNHDCKKKNRKHNLRLDNRDGGLVLE